MSGDFEKKISQQMDGFRLTPGPQVWEQVEAALPEKRKRRFAIWWWLPLAACLGGGVWLMIDKQPGTGKKIITSTAEKPSAEYTTGEKLSKQPPGDSSGNEAITHQQTATVSEKQNGIPPINKVSNTQVVPATNSISSVQITPDKKEAQTNNYASKSSIALQPAATKAPHVKAIAETKESKAETVPPVNDEPLENVTLKLNKATDDVPLQIPVNSYSILNQKPVLPIIDSANSHVVAATGERDTIVLNIMDTFPKTVAAIKLPSTKSNSRKTEWSLMLAVGKSSLSSSNSESQKNYDANNLYSSPGSNGQVRATGTFSNPTDGIAASAGIIRTQTISKHFTWEASLSYHLLTGKQRTGSRNDSLSSLLNEQKDASVFRISLMTNTSSPTLSNGSNTTITWINQSQRVHRIQVGTGVGYTLNPSAGWPIRFAAGGFVAYNISNNVLLHDYRSSSYIRSAALYNKWMWGGEVGLDVFINHTIKAGLFYQHDFTNVGKPKVRSVFRWNQMQLRVGIPLSKH